MNAETETVQGFSRTKTYDHHWTFNHQEDGEIISLRSKEHGKLHGLTLMMTDEMSIRREIIYEITKVIPSKDQLLVFEKIINKMVKNKWIGRGSGKSNQL